MSQETRVTDKGQTTIPKELREEHGIKPGDKIVWRETGGNIIIMKRSTTEGRGLLVPDDAPENEREDVAETLSEEVDKKREEEWAVE